MKLSAKDLNENIRLFLNDVEDYSEDPYYSLMCESTLNKFTQLITESSNIHNMLLEASKNTTNGHIFQDFIEYIETSGLA
jgi:hypothetical protein